MKHVMSWQDLECRSPTWYVFEGRKQEARVSLHLSDSIALGEGPRLHRPASEGAARSIVSCSATVVASLASAHPGLRYEIALKV